MKRWMFFTFSGFILILMTIMSMIQNFQFDKFYYKYSANTLFDKVERIEKSCNELDSDKRVLFMKRELSTFTLQTGNLFVLLNENGEVVFSVDFNKWNGKSEFTKIFTEEDGEGGGDDEKQILAQNIAAELVERTFTLTEPTYFLHEIEDMKILCSVYPFKTGEKLIFFTGTISADEVIAASGKFQFYLFNISLGISFICIHFISKKLNYSLGVVTKGAERMAQMDFKSIEIMKAPKEIKILGESLNFLGEKLGQTIDELNTANEKLEKELQRKVKLEEIRKCFLSDVSHELKTPITIIQSYSEALIDGIGDTVYYQEGIYDEADKMSQMVHELLQLSRVESEEVIFDYTPLNVNLIVEDTVRRLNSIVKEHNKSIIFKLPSEDLILMGDEMRIGQVVKNLLMNAIIYGEEHSPIEIELKQCEKEIILSISNPCGPVEEEELKYIWYRFYKIDDSRFRKKGGTGLGLSIVKSIVEKHNGICKVEYNDGWITFSISIPKAFNKQME